MFESEPEPVRVILTNDDIVFARSLAHLRQDAKNSFLRNRKKVCDTDAIDLHYIGVLGEVACGKYFCVDVDTTERIDGDKHEPDIFVNGHGCEVKATRRDDPHLIVEPYYDLRKADVLILCRVCEPAVDLLGCVSTLRFHCKHFLRPFGYGVKRAMFWKSLSNVNEILTRRRIEWPT